jgi:cytochrome c biogenesis factor
MGISRFQSTDRVTAAATLDVDRGDRPIGLITSERRQYFGLLGQPVGDPMTGIGIHRGPLQDVRAIFGQAATDEEAEYHVRIVPLMSLIWLGALLLLISGALSLVEAETSPRGSEANEGAESTMVSRT